MEMLDDPKIGTLTAWLKWRFVELLLVAAESDGSGTLPPVTQLAWRLRVDKDDLLKSLRALSEIGVVCEQGDHWKVTNFEKRQYSESMERVRQHREREREKKSYSNGKSNDDGNATVTATPSTLLSSVSSSKEGGLGGEKESKPEVPLPRTPAQAVEHPDIQVFQQICGRIPGDRDYALVIDTIRFLRGRYKERLIDQVTPYWLAWSGRKNKDGKKYNPAILVWLTEWAVNEQIPDDGNEPRKPTKAPDPFASLKRHLEQQEAKT